MNRNLAYSVLPLLALSAVLQAIMGNPDLGIFSFPVNVALLLALGGVLYVLTKERMGERCLSALSSAHAAAIFVAMAGIGCLLIALFPEWNFQQSWIFSAVLLLLMSNLFLAIFRYKGRFKLRFYLNHVGLLLLIASLSLGAADMRRMRAVVNIGDTVDKAYMENGLPYSLGYEVKLESFDADFYENNVPSEFRAVLSCEGEQHTIRVNHPWRKTWCEDIYLTGYDTKAGADSQYCILEFIVQPWKYVAVVAIVLFAVGAVLLLWGGRQRN